MILTYTYESHCRFCSEFLIPQDGVLTSYFPHHLQSWRGAGAGGLNIGRVSRLCQFMLPETSLAM